METNNKDEISKVVLEATNKTFNLGIEFAAQLAILHGYTKFAVELRKHKKPEDKE